MLNLSGAINLGGLGITVHCSTCWLVDCTEDSRNASAYYCDGLHMVFDAMCFCLPGSMLV